MSALPERQTIDLNGYLYELATGGGKWSEIGTLGLDVSSGIIKEAYLADLRWPECIPLYERLYRSDPEVTMMRTVIDALSRKQTITFALDPKVDNPTDDDLAAVDFGNEVLDDIEGGVDKWFNAAMSRVPFYGWGWWEAVPGLRQEGWAPPTKNDDWRSDYNDGLVGYRRFAFRRYTSFYSWDIDDDTGRLLGLKQHDVPNPEVTIPLKRSLHVTFGDSDNPEGLAMFEALYRLERVKHAMEMILGIGFERSAGYVSFTAESDLTGADKTLIRQAAKSVATAKEGNYLALPAKIRAEIVDSAFTSAPALLDAIRYEGVLKLALVGMQWLALGTMSPYGSYSAIGDANQFFLSMYNAISDGVVKQADEQIGKRLYNYPANKDAFPNMTKRPVLTVNKAEKMVDLGALGQFVTSMVTAGMPMDDDDWISIRRKSDFLPEEMPQFEEETMLPDTENQETPGEEEVEEGMTEEGAPELDEADLARRIFTVDESEEPTNTAHISIITEQDISRAMKKFEKWADDNEPELADILKATVIEEGNAGKG